MPFPSISYAGNVHFDAAVFVEMPPFERYRALHLDDEAFRALQAMLLRNPLAGDVIQGTGGLRKARLRDDRRHKGRRGGLRFIYYCWLERRQFWLFVIYDKDSQDDLTPGQRHTLKHLLHTELNARTAL